MSKLFSRIIVLILFIVLPGLAHAANSASVPKIVVTIKPLHGLVSAVTQGVTEPVLLIPGTTSPHEFSLKPSTALLLQNAQLVFWIGPEIETSLENPIQNLSAKARVVDFTQFEKNLGPHVWLDPENAHAMVRIISEALSEMDPENAQIYQGNAADFYGKLDVLEARIFAKLAPVSQEPFITYHDAYAHFVARFGLNHLASISISETQQPGIRRLRELKELMVQNDVRCVFNEPQFEARIISILLEGTTATEGILDPIGADIAPGPEHYAQLLNTMADAIVECLTE